MFTRQTRARFRTRPSEARPGIVLESSSHAAIDFCKRRRSTANDLTFRIKKSASKSRKTKKLAAEKEKEDEFNAKEAKRMNAMFEEAYDFSFIIEAVPVDNDNDDVPSAGPLPNDARSSTFAVANSMMDYTTTDDDSFFLGLPSASDGSISVFSPALQTSSVVDENGDMRSPISKSIRLDPRFSTLTAVENTTTRAVSEDETQSNTIPSDVTQSSGRTSRSLRSTSRSSVQSAADSYIESDPTLAEDKTQSTSSRSVRFSFIQSTVKDRTLVDDGEDEKQNETSATLPLDGTQSSGRTSHVSALKAVDKTQLESFVTSPSEKAQPSRRTLRSSRFIPHRSSVQTAAEDATQLANDETGTQSDTITSLPLDEAQMSDRPSRSVRVDSRISILTAVDQTTQSDVDDTQSDSFTTDKKQLASRTSKSSLLTLNSVRTAAEESMLAEDGTQFETLAKLPPEEAQQSRRTLRSSRLTRNNSVWTAVEGLSLAIDGDGGADISPTLPLENTQTLKSVRFDPCTSTLTAVGDTTSVIDDDNEKTPTDTSTVSFIRTAKSKSLRAEPCVSMLTAGEHSIIVKNASVMVSSSGETLLSGDTLTAGDESDEMSSGEEDSDDAPLQINTLHKFYYLRDFDGVSSNINYALHVCRQKAVASWTDLSPDGFVDCKKIGEGTYGEVFKTVVDGEAVALKVIPFVDEVQTYEGLVNGERMKHTLEILPEMLITHELSSLADEQPNLRAGFMTPSFVRVVRMAIVQDDYAPRLLHEWDKFAKRTENDRPDVYSSPKQLFIVFAMSLGGKDLESYTIKNEREAFSIFFQLALSLIVAEETLEFEHRDLHWGNVLINGCGAAEPIRYLIDGEEVVLRANNVRVSIIDFTNSRMRREETTIFLDLSTDEELFKGQGDYQFDIYRMMREHNRDDWMRFSPYTNVCWMDYIATKIFNAPKIPARRRKEILRTFGGLRKANRLAAFLKEPPIAELLDQYRFR